MTENDASDTHFETLSDTAESISGKHSLNTFTVRDPSIFTDSIYIYSTRPEQQLDGSARDVTSKKAMYEAQLALCDTDKDMSNVRMDVVRARAKNGKSLGYVKVTFEYLDAAKKDIVVDALQAQQLILIRNGEEAFLPKYAIAIASLERVQPVLPVLAATMSENYKVVTERLKSQTSMILDQTAIKLAEAAEINKQSTERYVKLLDDLNHFLDRIEATPPMALETAEVTTLGEKTTRMIIKGKYALHDAFTVHTDWASYEHTSCSLPLLVFMIVNENEEPHKCTGGYPNLPLQLGIKSCSLHSASIFLSMAIYTLLIAPIDTYGLTHASVDRRIERYLGVSWANYVPYRRKSGSGIAVIQPPLSGRVVAATELLVRIDALLWCGERHWAARVIQAAWHHHRLHPRVVL